MKAKYEKIQKVYFSMLEKFSATAMKCLRHNWSELFKIIKHALLDISTGNIVSC